MKRIQDWSMRELEDIVWETSGKSGDHIVPLWSIQQVNEILEAIDGHRQPEHEIGSVGKNTNSGSSTVDASHGEEAGSFHPSSEVRSSSMLDGSWSQALNGPAPAATGTKCIADVSALSSEDVIVLDRCGEDNKIDSVCNTIYLKDAALGTNGTPDNNRGCHLSPADSSSLNTDLDLENSKDKDIDLMDYDWPDISNMEDIDRQFRNCNSTFGQESACYADELSWFSSSSHGGCGFEDTFELGLHSSCSNFSVLNSTSALSGVNSNLSHKNDLLAANDDKPPAFGTCAYAEWLDSTAETEWNYSPTEQANDGKDGTKVSATTQISNENILFRSKDNDAIGDRAKPLESRYVSSEKARVQHSECNNSNSEGRSGKKRPRVEEKIVTSAASEHQAYSYFSDQKLYSGSTSGSTSSHQEQAEYHLLTHQVPFSPIRSSGKFENESHRSTSYKVSDRLISDVPQRVDRLDHHLSKSVSMATQEDIDNQQIRQQLSEVLMPKLPSQQNASTSAIQKYPKYSQLQFEIGNSNLFVDRNSEHPAVKVDAFTAHESSYLTSVSSDDSLKETSFWQLHNVMDQLDGRTTLSLRDGLYRLARSAEERHGFTYANNQIRASKGTGSCSAESLKTYAEYVDTETNTNPIDRAIAHLLFYGPSEGVSMSVSDATSIMSLPCYINHVSPSLLS